MNNDEIIITLKNGERVAQSQLSDFHAANKVAEAKRLKAAQAAAKKPLSFCPFSGALNPICRGDECAVHIPQGCSLKFIFDRPPAVKSTEGRRCPISGRQCAPTCALSETGACVFTSI